MAGATTDLPLAPQNERSARRVAFEAHVALLEAFLARRGEIVARIEALLNAQRKPAEYLQDTTLLARHFEDCFFTPGEAPGSALGLRRELEEAHWASGFKPRQTPGQHNDLIEPAEMTSRAFHLWQRTRWPGHHGRVAFAHTLFNVYLLRRLMLLAMRVFDGGSPSASVRLGQLQRLLDELARGTPTDQPVLVRDARWLLPLAQSPTTDRLDGYFEVARQIEDTLPSEDRVAIHRAGVRMAGGHLRSQLRHVSEQQGVPLDDPGLVSITRKSNALDLATLVQALVPVLEAYERAVELGDAEHRSELADAICQGISPDPELFVNRLDLLAPYSMIEHLFVAPGRAGHTGYTAIGQRHLRFVAEYAARIRRASKALLDDCPRFRPAAGVYSPYGALYGFSSRLLEHMALKATQPGAPTRFSIEDVFVAGDADKLAWVSGWRNLPHVPREVVKLFAYPQSFAEAIFARVERALCRSADGAAHTPERNGRLFVASADARQDRETSALPALPAKYFVTSDRQVVAKHQALAYDDTQFLHSRTEGEFLVSYATAGGWAALTKDLLTEVLGAGRDARVVGLPDDAARVLKAMCPELVVLAEREGV